MTTAGDGNGGIIGVNNPTAATPPTNPTLGGASGVWDINDVFLARKRSQWPKALKGSISATGGTMLTFADPTSPTGFSIVHTFTGTGTFSVTDAPPTASVSYQVVAGGGGPGGGPFPAGNRGGGGGGGFRTGTTPISAGSYPVVVGAGGGQGSPSSALGVTSAGGGRGGNADIAPINGSPGGSGGGGGNYQGSGGAGNSPPVSPPQGNPGTPGPGAGGGGPGGGAGGPGIGGVTNNFDGTTRTYSQGGPNPAPTNYGSGTGAVGVVMIKYPAS